MHYKSSIGMFLTLILALGLLAGAGCYKDAEPENTAETNAKPLAPAPAETIPESSPAPPVEKEAPKAQRPQVPGRWREASLAADAETQAAIEQLEALGYLAGTVIAGDHIGVTIHQRKRAWQGLNFFTSGHAPAAFLMDMNGKILHKWEYGFKKVWPNRRSNIFAPGTEHWRRAVLLRNGDVIAIFEGSGIIKVDKDSKLLWSNPVRAHHDLQALPNGDTLVLTRKAHIIPRLNEKQPILEDFITVLGKNGKIKSELSILECLENSPYFEEFKKRRKQLQGDIFHTNSLKILDGRLAEEMPAFKKGNYLISLLTVSAVAVVDPEAKSVVWWKTGNFRAQHEPQILENKRMLLFDNKGRTGQSAVIELNLAGNKLAWQYRGTKENPFYSATCGTAWRLPNGNTLIVESDNGRAFEVNQRKETVWEFHSPHRAGENDRFVATLFDMRRFPLKFGSAWLSPKENASPIPPEPEKKPLENKPLEETPVSSAS